MDKWTGIKADGAAALQDNLAGVGAALKEKYQTRWGRMRRRASRKTSEEWDEEKRERKKKVAFDRLAGALVRTSTASRNSYHKGLVANGVASKEHRLFMEGNWAPEQRGPGG